MLTSSSSGTRPPSLWKTLPDVGGTPSRLASSPTMITTVSPKTKPVTIGLERNSATQPTPSSPAAMSHSPEAIASPAVRVIASEGSPPAWLATSDPESTDTVDTGPTNSCREVPSTAYASSASGMAYRPTWTGTPAIPA